MLARLAENGIYRRSGHVTWHGDFLMTVLTALGVCERIQAAPEVPAPQQRLRQPRSSGQRRGIEKSKRQGHHRRPPEACLLCHRVQGRCKRHGGPNRSTSFGGATPRCSYCKRPKGHAPTCRRAR